MHELSILEGMIQGIQEKAQAEGFGRVVQVRLEVGRLSGAEPEALRFAFEVVSMDTLAQSATLEILEIPGSGLCQSCKRQVEIQARYDLCPACGDGFVMVTGGTELRIKDMDVEGEA